MKDLKNMHNKFRYIFKGQLIMDPSPVTGFERTTFFTNFFWDIN